MRTLLVLTTLGAELAAVVATGCSSKNPCSEGSVVCIPQYDEGHSVCCQPGQHCCSVGPTYNWCQDDPCGTPCADNLSCDYRRLCLKSNPTSWGPGGKLEPGAGYVYDAECTHDCDVSRKCGSSYCCGPGTRCDTRTRDCVADLASDGGGADGPGPDATPADAATD